MDIDEKLAVVKQPRSMSALTEQQKLIIKETLDGKSAKEISEEHGIPVRSVYNTRAHYGEVISGIAEESLRTDRWKLFLTIKDNTVKGSAAFARLWNDKIKPESEGDGGGTRVYGDQNITVNQMRIELDDMEKEFEAEIYEDDAKILDGDVESGADELAGVGEALPSDKERC